MARRIEDYGLIGDTHTAALVGRDGSIDWLCLPRFDAGACFAALLGDEENGRWWIAPTDPDATVRREYIEDTLVLRTEFTTADGVAEVIDLMPAPTRENDVDLLRVVRCTKGSVEMTMDLRLRFDYGSVVPWVQRQPFGLRAIAGPNGIDFHSPVPLHNVDFRTEATFRLSEGEEAPFLMVWYPSHHPAPAPVDPKAALTETVRWWQEWAKQCTAQGEYREQMKRWLITLKALTYAPTGGIVAAPTTSLPEMPGGERNWDYRYCWLRDATFTLYALLIGGFDGEAQAWETWLLRAVAGRPEQLQIMFGLGGERLLPEYEVQWLAGYEGSRPVRIGNAAHEQLQLDVYGEVMDVFHVARRAGLGGNEAAWAFQRELMVVLEKLWTSPDEGLWEVRGPRRHFTHSKVMAWVAFDRAVKAVEWHGLDGPVERWRELRETVHRDVCEKGFNAEKNAFVQYYSSDELDAALLMMPLVGFLPADDPRVVSTTEAIQRELDQNGFVRRYNTKPEVDGLPPGEGYFLPCTLWLADVLSLQGRWDEAREVFERVVSITNDLGLLAEEWDADAGRQLGNFPQAFSHVGLINTAYNLGLRKGPAQDRASG